VIRRDFITLLGGVAAAWPLVARAQQSGKMTIGFLGSGTPETQGPLVTAFTLRLGELGWIEGRNLAIQTRWADGHNERFVEFAAEFVRLNVDIIVTPATPGVIAAKQISSTTPIVFAGPGDPVGSGLVTSLSRPGGNVTGLSQQQTDLAGKRLELLREVVPGLRRLAVIVGFANPPSLLEASDVDALAGPLGIKVVKFEITRSEDIAASFGSIKRQTDALYTVNDPLLNANRVRIITVGLAARLPTIHGLREYVVSGGLMSYGPSLSALFRRAAEMVDKILRGTKPNEIPVEQPTKFDLVINLTTAKVLDVIVPPTLLARADEVIE
jgi:putative tryptophan/tyrosine transport system substrate-binding protein